MFLEKKSGELVYLASDQLGAPHAFTTRLGGVSRGHLASLNLGENRGDDPDAVRENYARLGAALGFDYRSAVFTRQVHGARVRIVTGADRHTLFEAVPYEADGIVTNEPGLPLVCFTADCVPVLLCDAGAGVAGAIHCGWRSSVQDILGAAVGAMMELGAQPARIHAAIGPAISACCFETGPEVPAAVDAWLGAAGRNYYRPKTDTPGKFLVDLKGANACRLEQLGLEKAHIDISDACTMCQPEKFWSHRATKGLRGSQAGVIFLPGLQSSCEQ